MVSLNSITNIEKPYSSFNSVYSSHINISENTVFDKMIFFYEISQSSYLTKGFHSLVFIILYSITILLGLVVNMLVIVTIIKFRHMRTITNIFVVNLAVFDLLVVLFCMPIRLVSEINSQWFYGEIACKFSGYIQDSSVSGSILTLTIISCTRIYAVQFPFKVRIFLTKYKLILMVLIIWIISFSFSIPMLMFKKLHFTEVNVDESMLISNTSYYENSSTAFQNSNNGDIFYSFKIMACIEDWQMINNSFKKSYNLVSFCIFYCLPLLVIFGNYFKIIYQMLINTCISKENRNTRLYEMKRLNRYRAHHKSDFENTSVFNSSLNNASSMFDSLKFSNGDINDAEFNGSVRFKQLQNLKFDDKKSYLSVKIPQCSNLQKEANSTRIASVKNNSNYMRRTYLQRRQVCKIFVFISGLFGISWAPIQILNLLFEFKYDFNEMKNYNIIYYYALLFGHINSIANPLCYALLCKKFRKCYSRTQKAKRYQLHYVFK